ncbi:hypothetical protein OR1_03628 [Geobacter sp. OR-1]|uniref:hypothetical protein n=1 Tax=Geobacter sp. OR-1 TaxID=1266765 RepID=UPI0005432383|nr:hypothetical protein [Geobacter sp. OR-1]GAM11315.1 hypothetical protein OR1_03628 [Geobacter sp. OR-1]
MSVKIYRNTTKPEVIGSCPQCHSEVLDGKQKYYCTNLFKGKCRFSLNKHYFRRWGEMRPLSKAGMSHLLLGRGIRLKNLVTVRKGHMFDCLGYLAWIPQFNRWGIEFEDIYWHD